MNKLSVVIPAYNEAHRIASTLNAVDEFLEKQGYEYEILVVDDGSKDETVNIANSLKKQIRNLSVISNANNHGKGWVVRQGMLKASGQFRVFMDADNSTRIEEIGKFLPFFSQGYDLVIGSRRIAGSVIAVHQPWIRDFLGGVFRLIVHTLVPLRISDSQCGFKCFSEKSTSLIFPSQTIFRWAFDVELLALARKLKLKIKEVPIIWINDSESHVKLSGMLKMLVEVLEISWNLLTGKYGK